MRSLAVYTTCMVLLGLGAGRLTAQEPAADLPLAANTSGSSSFRLPWDDAPGDAGGKAAEAAAVTNVKHPLMPAVQYAKSVAEQIHRDVRDYTCIIVKRERIEDELQDFQSMRARVRCSRSAVDNQEAVPFSVYLDFLNPAKVHGRKVLFIAGQNDGKMLARNGGKHFNYVIVKLDPRSEAAMRESLVPITELGFENMTRILIRLLEENIQHDPNGTNSHLAFYRNAKVNQRTCTRTSVTHPTANPELAFASADVYVDDELHVPIRLEAYAWPNRPGGSPPLLFEYTYEDLRINMGLTAGDFTVSLLQPPGAAPTGN